MIETIKELEVICQNSKPEEESGIILRYMRIISIRFTWFFLHTSISSNQITYLSMIAGFLGGVFLSCGTVITFLIGALMFCLFEILDCCDGEVGRYRKNHTMTGNYLDLLAHYLIPPFLFTGLAFGIYQHNQTVFIFLLAFLGLMANMLVKISGATGWQVICVERLRELKKLKGGKRHIEYTVNLEESKGGKEYGESGLNIPENKKKNIVRFSIITFGIEYKASFYLGCAALANLFLPGLVVFNYKIGILEIYLLFFVLTYIVIAAYVIVKLVNEKKIEKAYRNFFQGGKEEISFWI